MLPLFVLVLAAAAVVLSAVFLRLTAIEQRLTALERRARQPSAPAPAALPRQTPPTTTDPVAAVPPTAVPAAVRCAVPDTSLPRTPRPAPPDAPSVAPTARAAAPAPHKSLESRIGTRWLLYIGVVAILVGVAYFEKLAIDNHWISGTTRVIQGAVVGLAMIAAGLRFRRRGLDLYGQMIAGCGVAILYVSTYAASTLYGLIGQVPALFCLLLITAGAAALAERMTSQGLAVLAAAGGFATPFLLGVPPRAEAALFTYDTILIGGCLLIDRRRGWRLPIVVAYLFTLFTVANWAGRYYRPSDYLETEIYLTIFAGLFLASAVMPVKRRRDAIDFILWTSLPAYYLASIAVLFDHQVALLVWLVLVMAAGAAASVPVGTRATLAVWAAVVMPLVVWADTAGRVWMSAGLIAIVTIYILALLVVLRDERKDAGASPASICLCHGSGLAAYAGAYLLLAPVSLNWAAGVAAAFGAWHLALGAGLHAARRERSLHVMALGTVLIAAALAIEFDAAWISVGWAVEGAALVVLGLHERRGWLRGTGGMLLLLAGLQILWLLDRPLEAHAAAFLNTRSLSALVVIAMLYVVAWRYRRDPSIGDRGLAIGVSLLAAQLIVLTVLTIELRRYWDPDVFAAEVSVSGVWALGAAVLIGVGLWRRYAPIRYFAMALFTLTIVKVFLVDMAELQRGYRVASVIVLGVLLLITSYGYQRQRDRT